MRDAAIGAAQLRDGSVTAAKLAAGAVHPLGPNSVGAANIQDGAVTGAKLAANAVGTSNIANGAVTGAKVAPNSLTGANIDESTLHVVRVVHRVSGSAAVTVGPDSDSAVRYPLTQGNPYVQPAPIFDLLFGTWRVRFPAGCTGFRSALIEVQGPRVYLRGSVFDEGTGEVTTEEAPITGVEGLVLRPKRRSRP